MHAHHVAKCLVSILQPDQSCKQEPLDCLRPCIHFSTLLKTTNTWFSRPMSIKKNPISTIIINHISVPVISADWHIGQASLFMAILWRGYQLSSLHWNIYQLTTLYTKPKTTLYFFCLNIFGHKFICLENSQMLHSTFQLK